MAAYAALLGLERAIDQIPHHDKDYISLKIPNSHNYVVHIHLCRKEEMKLVHDHVIFLEEHLEKFPKKIFLLESRIKDVCYQLEDIIESFMSGPPYFSFQSDEYGREFNWTQMIYAFRKCTQQLGFIVDEAKGAIQNSTTEKVSISKSWTSETSSNRPPTGKDTLVGLDDDLRELLSRATGHAPALQFIPIVGMGGIGKTTLARNVYENPLIKQYFDVTSWITVSQEYDVQKILLGLLQCEGEHGEHVESLIKRLHQSLIGQKFLVVLDDMWHAKVWDKVMRAFPDESNSSRIIITTRLSELAEYIDSSSAIHQMKFLNRDHSWSLVCEKVFGQEDCPSQLVNIGKRIAKNCKGLPLAIIVIAGLLKLNKAHDYWEMIARNVIEAVNDISNDPLLKIFSLSYDNLPHHLKACFLYIGVFPEDGEIWAKELIYLLVGEGLIKAKGNKSMEEVAEDYLKDLAQRNLVFLSHQLASGFETFCRMHDVLRELSIRKSQEENFHQHFKNMDGIHLPAGTIRGERRIILHHSNFPPVPNNNTNTPHLCSILYFGLDDRVSALHTFTSHFKLLKMVYGLHIKEEDISSTDSIIFKLIHLRFLGMKLCNYRNSRIKFYMHESIVKLQNLRTLKIQNKNPIVLPWNIWTMQKLRHLHLSEVCIVLLPHFQHSLQTLLSVNNFKFTKNEIKNLPNLKTLTVSYDYEEDNNWEESCCLNNIVHLHQLQDLKFNTKDIGEELRFTIPRNLIFPHGLKRLMLHGLKVHGEKMSDIGLLLVNLELLILSNCAFEGRRWEPTEGGFLQLKYLKFISVKLEEWDAEDTHFPCLEELYLMVCSFEIPESIGDIPTLRMLRAMSCFKGTRESVKRIQEEQLNNGNETLHILIEGFHWSESNEEYMDEDDEDTGDY